jgi:hypothetical protein
VQQVRRNHDSANVEELMAIADKIEITTPETLHEGNR